MSSRRGVGRAACAAGLALVLCVSPLAGCAQMGSVTSQSTEAAASSGTTVSTDGRDSSKVCVVSVEDLVSDRDLEGTYEESEATKVVLSDSGCSVDGSGAAAEGSTVTITKAGTYVISGSLSDGQVVVDADGEKVQLVLDGASVSSSSSAALYVKNAKKVWVTLAEGSQNSLATSGEYVQTDDNNVDGTLFSKDDLAVNGTGSLSVTSATGHGIVCKDALVLVSGSVDVTAANHAIQAKDSVAVIDGTWTLSAGKDGIHCENGDDATLGSICLAGGTLSVTAGSDGFDAGRYLEVDGGTIGVAAGDDGLHAEYDLVVNGGTVTVSQSYEGIEGSTVTVTGGEIDVTSSDDGINAAGEPSEDATDGSGSDSGAAQTTDGGAQPFPTSGGAPSDPPANDNAPGGEAPGDGGVPSGEAPTDGDAPSGDGAPSGMPDDGFDEADDTAKVTITGGSINIVAGGDGIDSNGDLLVSGGETYVSGPTSDGDGSLDYAGEATVTGGVVMCAGSSGMAQNFGDASTQGSLLVSASGSAGDVVSLADANGNVLASFTARASYSCVLVSASGIADGETYTLTCGSTTTEVTMDGLVYSNVSGGFGKDGGPGGNGGPGGGAPGGDNSGDNGGGPGGGAFGEAPQQG